MNFKMEESDLLDMRQVAAVYHMSMTELIRAAIKEYIGELKRDPYYRLTAQVQDASPEETEEILDAIEDLSDEDLEIASMKRFTV